MRRVVVAVVLMSSASGGVYSQGPHFEVASIKTVQPTMGGQSVRGDPGRIDYKQVSLKELILRAFAVPWYRVVWPDWLKDPARGQLPYYDVAATLPAGTPKAQVPLMLQTLLAERLKLTVHREKRDLPVYAMLISKGGIRMHPAKRDADADPDAEPHNVYSVGLGSPEGHITGELPVPAIANSLRNELDRPMVDMTGLEGNFDIDLHWAHEAEPLPGRGAPLAETASMPTGGNTASLFAALEKQLGIHVEARKIPAEMLIIDRVERVPTEN